MRKILELLKFKDRKYSWFDLDPEIQNSFYIKFAACLVVLIFGIVFLIYTKDITMGGAIILLSIIYFGTVLYNLGIFLYGKFHVIIGYCSDVERKSAALLKTTVYGNCKMNVVSDKMYYEVAIPYNSKFKDGNKVAVYCMECNIYQIKGDLYKINSPLAISTISQK